MKTTSSFCLWYYFLDFLPSNNDIKYHMKSKHSCKIQETRKNNWIEESKNHDNRNQFHSPIIESKTSSSFSFLWYYFLDIFLHLTHGQDQLKVSDHKEGVTDNVMIYNTHWLISPPNVDGTASQPRNHLIVFNQCASSSMMMLCALLYYCEKR